MPGPDPKSPSVRARANKATTRALLVAPEPEDIKIPKLPTRYGPARMSAKTGKMLKPLVLKWHPETLAWWREIHGSPMSTEWDTSDEWGLKRLAILVDQFNWSGSPAIHAEIRLAQRDFGLTPLDRRRLEWTIESTERAKAEGKKRKAAEPPVVQSVPQPIESDDPRYSVA